MKLTPDSLIWTGRFLDDDGTRYFDYSASGFEFSFAGTKADAIILSDPGNHAETNHGVIAVFTAKYGEEFSEAPDKRIVLDKNVNGITLFESEKKQKVSIKVMKFSECAFGSAGLKSLEIDGKLLRTKDNPDAPKIEFIGDSITCGYGLEGKWNEDTFTTLTERPDLAYAVKTARKLGAKYSLVSWSGIGIISSYVDPSVNLPNTIWNMPTCWPYTDKSISLRLKKEPEIWNESRFSPDVVVINLGTNDASYTRGQKDRIKNFTAAYRELIEDVHRRSPKAKICCCLGIMGQDLFPAVEEAVKLFKTDFPAVKIKAVKFPVQEEADGIGIDWHPSGITHEKASCLLSTELKEFI